MVKRYLLIFFLAAGFLVLAVPLVYAETLVRDTVVYETTFTTDPNWITNGPRSYYWVPDKGIYHYAIEPGTGGYAYVGVADAEGSYTLEYDVTPTSTVENSAFRFGYTTKEMDRTTGPVIMSEFTNGKYGRLMWLRAVTTSNKLMEISSQAFSYGEKTGAPTVNFEDNRTYHVVVQFDDQRDMLTMQVADKAKDTELWGYFINTKEDMKGMDRIAIGPLGDYGDNGPVAEGYIDNVRLTFKKTITVTDTPMTGTTTLAGETFTHTPVKTTTLPATVAEPASTPQSPLSPAGAAVAIGMMAAAVLYGRGRLNP